MIKMSRNILDDVVDNICSADGGSYCTLWYNEGGDILHVGPGGPDYLMSVNLRCDVLGMDSDVVMVVGGRLRESLESTEAQDEALRTVLETVERYRASGYHP